LLRLCSSSYSADGHLLRGLPTPLKFVGNAAQLLRLFLNCAPIDYAAVA